MTTYSKDDPLHLTIDEFLLSAQELVLRERHGPFPRAIAKATMGANVRALVKEALRSRKVECHVLFGVGDLVIRLSCHGIYEHEGRLCRIVYLSGDEAADRKAGPRPEELELIELADWVAEKYYATPPLGLRLYYHVFAGKVCESHISESWYREFPLRTDAEMQTRVAERAHRIAEALLRSDADLPECSSDERHATVAAPYRKCRDHCPARFRCQQIARYYEKQNAQNIANERALASIVAEEGPSFAEQQRARRQQQISMMLMSGNFFEADFPGDVFRKLLLDDAEDATTPPDTSAAYRDMAASWTDAQFVAWRAWLDRQED